MDEEINGQAEGAQVGGDQAAQAAGASQAPETIADPAPPPAAATAQGDQKAAEDLSFLDELDSLQLVQEQERNPGSRVEEILSKLQASSSDEPALLDDEVQALKQELVSLKQDLANERQRSEGEKIFGGIRDAVGRAVTGLETGNKKLDGVTNGLVLADAIYTLSRQGEGPVDQSAIEKRAKIVSSALKRWAMDFSKTQRAVEERKARVGTATRTATAVPEIKSEADFLKFAQSLTAAR